MTISETGLTKVTAPILERTDSKKERPTALHKLDRRDEEERRSKFKESYSKKKSDQKKLKLEEAVEKVQSPSLFDLAKEIRASQGVVSTLPIQNLVTSDLPIHKVRLELIPLVEQLIAKLKVVQTEGQRDITMQLRNIPLFKNVTLVVTEFSQAPHQFNLTFLNLTNPEARALIELNSAQDSLRKTLLEKGYNLHQITIEPKLEPVVQAQRYEPRESAHHGDSHQQDDSYPHDEDR